MTMSSFMNYVPGETIFHQIDPRTKLALLFVMVILPMLYVDLAYLCLMVICLILLAFISRISFPLVFAFIKPVLPLIIIMVVIQGLWGKELLYKIGPVGIYSDGMLFGCAMALRLLTIVLATAIVLITTNPADMIIGLRELGMPHKMAFMVLTALRFVPTLMARAVLIQDVQKARGMKSGDEAGNFIKRITALIPVLIPLYIASLEMAERLSLAMEARGFGASPQITYSKDLHMSRMDYSIVFVVGIVLLIGIAIRILGFGVQPLGTILALGYL